MQKIPIDSVIRTGIIRKRFYAVREYALIEIVAQKVDREPSRIAKLIAYLKAEITKLLSRTPKEPQQEG